MANKRDHDSLRPHSSVPGRAAHRALRLAAAPLARVARMFGGGGGNARLNVLPASPQSLIPAR